MGVKDMGCGKIGKGADEILVDPALVGFGIFYREIGEGPPGIHISGGRINPKLNGPLRECRITQDLGNPGCLPGDLNVFIGAAYFSTLVQGLGEGLQSFCRMSRKLGQGACPSQVAHERILTVFGKVTLVGPKNRLSDPGCRNGHGISGSSRAAPGFVGEGHDPINLRFREVDSPGLSNV